MKRLLIFVFSAIGTFSQALNLDSLRLVVPVGHGGVISQMLVTEDSKYLFTGSDDTSVKLWEISSGKLINSFNGP